jgi:hypothetical protein
MSSDISSSEILRCPNCGHIFASEVVITKIEQDRAKIRIKSQKDIRWTERRYERGQSFRSALALVVLPFLFFWYFVYWAFIGSFGKEWVILLLCALGYPFLWSKKKDSIRYIKACYRYFRFVKNHYLRKLRGRLTSRSS